MRTRLYARVNLCLLAALVGGSAWAYPRLPGRIPIHFDLAGRPDGWEERSPFSWFFLPVLAAALAAFLHLASSCSRRSPELWNLPEKRRFLAMDEAAQAPIIARMQELMAFIGAGATAVLALVQLSVYQASKNADGGGSLTLIAVAIPAVLAVLIHRAVRTHAEVRRMVREAP